MAGSLREDGSNESHAGVPSRRDEASAPDSGHGDLDDSLPTLLKDSLYLESDDLLEASASEAVALSPEPVVDLVPDPADREPAGLPFEDPEMASASLRLALRDGGTHVLAPRGAPLPFSTVFRGTISPKEATDGASRDWSISLMYGVPDLLGGESDRESSCLKVGSLRMENLWLKGAEDSEVPAELCFYVNVDRGVRAYAFLTESARVIECRFEAEVFAPDLEMWRQQFSEIKERLEVLEYRAGNGGESAEAIAKANARGMVAEIDAVLGDPSWPLTRRGYRAYKQFLCLLGTIEAMRRQQ